MITFFKENPTHLHPYFDSGENIGEKLVPCPYCEITDKEPIRRRTMMQIIYKMFVSDKELVNNLPLFTPVRGKEKLERIVRLMRKHLFFRKIRSFFK